RQKDSEEPVALFLGALVFVGLAVALVGGVVWFVVRAALWLILLPFRLLFLAIGLPLAIVGTVLGVVGTVVLGALLFSAGILAAVFVSMLLPVLILAGLAWLIVRLVRPATAR